MVTNRCKILLIEDNPADVRLTVEAFRENHFDEIFYTVKDGVEAIMFLRKQGAYSDVPVPDLILLDLNLPKKNGREVLAEIKHDPELKRIPVVVLTTSNADEDIERSYDLHANCYITKPVDLDDFIYIAKTIKEFWFRIAILPSEAGECYLNI